MLGKANSVRWGVSCHIDHAGFDCGADHIASPEVPVHHWHGEVWAPTKHPGATLQPWKGLAVTAEVAVAPC